MPNCKRSHRFSEVQEKEHCNTAATLSQFLGRTALVTGAARGQGRAHAIRLAQEGANVTVLDICRDLDSPTYPGATESDLADTVKAIEHAGRAAFASAADVRDYEELQRFIADARLAESSPSARRRTRRRPEGKR